MSYQNAQYVYQNIFLGSIDSANDRQWLIDNGITHILGIVGGQTMYPEIDYLIYSDVYDSPDQNIIKYFKSSFEFIEKSLKSNGRVLIHCHAGISRSSSIVIGYIMCKYNMKFIDAFNITKKARSIVYPNYGFVVQLKVLDNLDSDEKKNFLS